MIRGLVLAVIAAIPFMAHAQTSETVPSPTPTLRPESCVRIIDPEAGVANSLAAAPAPERIAAKGSKSIPTGADSDLIDDLKKGGYVIFFRHAHTNWAERDSVEGDFSNRARQRNLSEAGQREAGQVGIAFKILEIPIDRVLASPMWRCRDTAEFAFGQYDTTGLLFWKGASFREARIKMLSTAPSKGKNLILVGHQDQLIPIVPGLQRDQLAEGDALIFKPEGGEKFKVVRQVTPFDWANAAGMSTAGFLPESTPAGSMPAAPPDSTKAPQGLEK